jgi:prevent-host-death family protein
MKWSFWSLESAYNGLMKRASISELKTSLSAYLRGVKRGEEILVTERGRPIARLVPALGAEPASERKSRLIRTGILRPGSTKVSPDLWNPSPVRDPEGKLLRSLLEERRSGR